MNNIYLENFIDYLRQVVNTEYSVKDISESTGIYHNLITDWLKGDYQPSLKNAIKIANFLDCSLDYMFQFTSYKHFKHRIPYVSFETRLDALMRETHIGYNKIITELDLSNSSVSKWRKGSLPRLNVVPCLAKLFDVSVEYLIGRTDEKWL